VRPSSRCALLGVVALAGCQLVLPVNEGPLPAPSDGGGADAGDAGVARRLFASDFEEPVALAAPSGCGGGNCKQAITGGAWPLALWGAEASAIQLFAGPAESVDGSSIGRYMVNDLVTLTGRAGQPTRALHQRLAQVPSGGGIDQLFIRTDGPGQTARAQGPLYIAYDLRLGDQAALLGPGGYHGLFELYQGGSRFELIVTIDPGRRAVWNLKSHFPSGAGRSDWTESNAATPVPADWFRLEIYWKPDERLWIAAGGARLVEHRGPNLVGEGPVTSVHVFVNGASKAPSEQWVDDLEIWDDFPPTAAPH
jgi:hypothetical protein